ncbi:MAG: TIGR02530 family flagellar biosynthesis protein [Dehalococcoidia bacterium]
MDPLRLIPAQPGLRPSERQTTPARQPQGPAPASFEDALAQQLDQATGLRFSKHALSRLSKRNIQLTPQHMERLSDAVERAKAKGARESLVLMDDLALVVSIRNQTVITATSAESRRGNVFTNIDSAVIA